MKVSRSSATSHQDLVFIPTKHNATVAPGPEKPRILLQAGHYITGWGTHAHERSACEKETVRISLRPRSPHLRSPDKKQPTPQAHDEGRKWVNRKSHRPQIDLPVKTTRTITGGGGKRQLFREMPARWPSPRLPCRYMADANSLPYAPKSIINARHDTWQFQKAIPRRTSFGAQSASIKV